ncbi:WecB/TagA/CpsF family glycosyltransferase [Polynucleobacter paneuropaeus]|jgi:beta-1,4-glucosyltransferase|nr:WecB/TagA/CpsF family glycosyltransferase [Polynucleobacter paneuropaeus]MBT8612039.1 WecB/TagA/CpsF family glycosyltransferase [Polynucleobacter paneuropaeus]
MSYQMKILEFLNFNIADTSIDQTLPFLLSSLTLKSQVIILFANTNFILKCKSLAASIKSKKILVLNDGIGLDIGCMILHGRRFRENLNGTDFTKTLLQRLPRGHKVFLLGSTDNALRGTSRYIEENFQHNVVGCVNGFNGPENFLVIDQINESGAQILLVAMGNPRQENWILQNHSSINPRLILGVGALFDFWSGERLRAPRWMQKIHMEWLFRLALEPKRLLQRYSIDIIFFLSLCLWGRVRTKLE